MRLCPPQPVATQRAGSITRPSANAEDKVPPSKGTGSPATPIVEHAHNPRVADNLSRRDAASPGVRALRLRGGLQTSQRVVDALVVPGVDQRIVDALWFRQPVLLRESQLRLELPEVPAGHRP